MKSNSSSDILKDNASSGTSFSRDVFRHLKDIIRKTPHSTTEEDTDDEESYGFKQLEQKLKERREKEKAEEEQKKEETSRLRELEREQCKKLPEPRLSAQLPGRTRNSIAACTRARRSHDGVMTSHSRQNNFVRTPNLSRKQREHIVQRLEKFKKNPPNQDAAATSQQRRKESTASLQGSGVAKYQVKYLKDVKYCNDPRNRRFNVEQAAHKAQSSHHSPHILPFVLAKVTQNNNNNRPSDVYYDDTGASRPDGKNPRPETNLNRNLAFMTSQEMYEEKRDARRKLRSDQKAQRGRPLDGGREKGVRERCASEENVFSKAQQFRQKLHRQKSCEDPQERNAPSVRRRHTLRDDDDVTNRNLKSRKGQKPPDYNRAVTSSNQRRHKMESYL